MRFVKETAPVDDSEFESSSSICTLSWNVHPSDTAMVVYYQYFADITLIQPMEGYLSS